jgi:hypothetical protein
MAAMYQRVRRQPKEGTITAAILVHSQACGLVAYAYDVHPDAVARVVAECAHEMEWPEKLLR